MDVSALIGEYLESNEEHKERNDRLYVTDVGRCPRSVAYDLMGAKKRTLSKHKAANKRFMFRLAHHVETDVGQALAHARIEYISQHPLEIDDHENWGGRPDFVIVRNGEMAYGIEVKSLHPNAFRFELPKKEHIYQTTIYKEYTKTPEDWLLWYGDRGGANTPQQFVVSSLLRDDCARLMDELDAVRAALPDIPPPAPKVLKFTDKIRGVAQYKKVRLVPDWHCEYCDHREASCFPDMRTETWAEWTNGWVPTRKANVDALSAFGVALS